MILDSRKPDGPECLAALGLTFAVNLRPEEGGETVELIPNGASVAVTPGNVLDYVKKYAMLRMVKINGESLQVQHSVCVSSLVYVWDIFMCDKLLHVQTVLY